YLRRACGSGVSFYGQRAKESPRNSTLQDVRSPGSWRWTVSGQVKVEANAFSKAFPRRGTSSGAHLLAKQSTTHCQITARAYPSFRPWAHSRDWPPEYFE